MQINSTQGHTGQAIQKTFPTNLPPLSEEAYQLRQRLAEQFLHEPNSERGSRLLWLIERANVRFERRERLYREIATQKHKDA